MRIFERKSRARVTATGMPDHVRRRNPKRLDEGRGMPNDRRHAVVLVAQRVAGKSLADLVEGDDLKPLRQRHEIQVPGMRTRSGVRRTEIPTVDENDRLATAGDMIGGFKTLDIDGLRWRQRSGGRGMIIHWALALFPLTASPINS